MTNLIVAVVLLVILGTAITYIIKEKKKGTVCIGCPNAGNCRSKQGKKSECSCQ